MTVKKTVKLINNERLCSKVASEKACDATSIDSCLYEDHAECVVYAEDTCRKDHAGCFEGAHDVCYSYRDTDLCFGAGESDID